MSKHFIKKSLLLLSIAGIGLGLSACGKSPEKRVKELGMYLEAVCDSKLKDRTSRASSWDVEGIDKEAMKKNVIKAFECQFSRIGEYNQPSYYTINFLVFDGDKAVTKHPLTAKHLKQKRYFVNHSYDKEKFTGIGRSESNTIFYYFRNFKNSDGSVPQYFISFLDDLDLFMSQL